MKNLKTLTLPFSHPRLDLHVRDARRRCRSRCEGEGIDGELGPHVLRPAAVDLSGRYVHKPHLIACVDELQGAVVVGEGSAVRVSNGGVLHVGEAHGTVPDGEPRDLDSRDLDCGRSRSEEDEEDHHDSDGDEDEETECEAAGGDNLRSASACVSTNGGNVAARRPGEVGGFLHRWRN
ncbi:hypothetical protein HPP92_023559 [Vanilla planifolia]|uniref:Uncharacterized protein n=1 Tax=Vanilla planifolia TaxID=51239 RepID=A0A835UDW0_VANPL|nr:hypothetical protein HPP92_023559 [Vanilla planifolia]